MNKLIENIKILIEKHKILLGFLSIVFVIGMYVFNNYSALIAPFTEGYVITDLGSTFDSDKKIRLEDNVELKQTFSINENTFSGIRVYLKGKYKSSMGRVTVSLWDEDKQECLITQQYLLKELKGSRITLKFDDVQKNVSGSSYSIRILAQDLGKTTRVFLNGRNEKEKTGKLYLGEKLQKERLYFKVYFNTKESIRYVSYGGFVYYFAALLLIFLFIYYRKIKIHNLFAVMALLIGILYSVIITPMAAPDEVAHYYSTYHVSNKIMGVKASKEGVVVGRTDDMILEGLTDETSAQTYTTAFEGMLLPIKNSELTEVEQETVGVYDYFYLPGAVGFVLARLFQLGTLPLMYLGRLFNLLAYIGMAYFAIKKIPFGKHLLTVIAISPMLLHQVSSLSYDALIFGLAYLYIAQSMEMIYSENEITWKHWLTLLITGVFLAPCKSGAYLPICFLILLIPIKKAGGRKKYILSMAGTLGIMTVSAAANYFVKSSNIAGVSVQHTVDWPGEPVPTYTLSYLWERPFSFVRLMLRTICHDTGEYITSMLGGSMGSSNIVVPVFWILCFLGILLLSVVLVKGETIKVSFRDKLWMFVICSGVFLLIEVAMLIGWTPTYYSSVIGVQGRYFLPILPLLMLLIRTDAIELKKDQTNKLLIGAFTVNLAIISIAFSYGVMR